MHFKVTVNGKVIYALKTTERQTTDVQFQLLFPNLINTPAKTLEFYCSINHVVSFALFMGQTFL